MSRVRLLLALSSATILACCSHAPPRPPSVPATADWAGGEDGGTYIDCRVSPDGGHDLCTVYGDGDGLVHASGWFVDSRTGRAASAARLEYLWFDEDRIHLRSGSDLEQVEAPRPRGVPPEAKLAKNGVFVDCRPENGAFGCGMYLAADGGPAGRGRFRPEGGCSDMSSPALAAPDLIIFDYGCILRRR